MRAITQIGAFDALTEATHRRVFEVNYFAAVEMARVLLLNVRGAKGHASGDILGRGLRAALSPGRLCRLETRARRGVQIAGQRRGRAWRAGADRRAPRSSPPIPAIPNARADGTARPGSAPDGIDYMEPEAARADHPARTCTGLALHPRWGGWRGASWVDQRGCAATFPLADGAPDQGVNRPAAARLVNLLPPAMLRFYPAAGRQPRGSRIVHPPRFGPDGQRLMLRQMIVVSDRKRRVSAASCAFIRRCAGLHMLAQNGARAIGLARAQGTQKPLLIPPSPRPRARGWAGRKVAS